MGIISGPGSFAVQFGDHLRSWDHLRTRTGSKATYKQKKYPAVQRPAKCNFSAWKMRRVQPLKHSRYLTSTEREWWPRTRASERAFMVLFRGNHPNTHRSWGAKLLGSYGTRRGMLNANVILYIKNQLWPHSLRSDQGIMLESSHCGRFCFTPIEITSVKNRN